MVIWANDTIWAFFFMLVIVMIVIVSFICAIYTIWAFFFMRMVMFMVMRVVMSMVVIVMMLTRVAMWTVHGFPNRVGMQFNLLLFSLLKLFRPVLLAFL